MLEVLTDNEDQHIIHIENMKGSAHDMNLYLVGVEADLGPDDPRCLQGLPCNCA